MKTYKVIVSFGDGKPLETTIDAKNGIAAQDLGFRSHPGARQIRIVGVLAEELPPPPPEVEHPLFSEPYFLEPTPKREPVQLTRSRKGPKLMKRESLIEEAVKLREGGWSYLAIARELDVGKTTVRQWMWEARVP
jgi:hypothetical protein